MVTGKLKFFNQKGELLLEEYDRNRFRENVEGEFNSALEISPRTFTPIMGTENFKLAVRFEPNDGEKIYGMGQYQQPYMDMKGCVVELATGIPRPAFPLPFPIKAMACSGTILPSEA